MNRFRNLIALFAFSLLVLALPNFASAQWRDNRRNNDDDYYGNNNRNNNNRNLQATVKNLKNRSNQFERRLDRELDNSRYDGRNREDRILQIAQQFKDAAERLDNAYDNRGDYNNSRDEAQRVIQLGSQLDRAISRTNISQNVSSDFSRIRQDLQVLANAYNTNYNNRNGNNRNNRRSNDDGYYDDDDDYNRNNRNNRRNTNNNGDWRNKIPFPLPF